MSYALGIDIGTSKIAVAVVDRNENLPVAYSSLASQADVCADGRRHEQDPEKIFRTVFEIIDSLAPVLRQKISTIGVTGQMHGVVMWNRHKTSSLFTWKDMRTLENGFLAAIKQVPGCRNLREGYGNATLAYLSRENKLSEWDYAATIHDYFVHKACALDKPLTDPADAASWGLFDAENRQWDFSAIQKLNIPKKILPDIVPTGTVAGELSEEYAKLMGLNQGVQVYVATGDNQSSIWGTSNDWRKEIYLTVGTGAQLSVIVPDTEITNLKLFKAELRPFTDELSLVVAAPLCGGQAFGWLIDGVQGWLNELGMSACPREKLYASIDTLALHSIDNSLSIKPNFLGERYDSTLRGEICGIDLTNFSLSNVSAALAAGIIENMYSMMPEILFKNKKLVVCSGNALRRLKILQKVVKNVFDLPIQITANPEEAAFGAAIMPFMALGNL